MGRESGLASRSQFIGLESEQGPRSKVAAKCNAKDRHVEYGPGKSGRGEILPGCWSRTDTSLALSSNRIRHQTRRRELRFDATEDSIQVQIGIAGRSALPFVFRRSGVGVKIRRAARRLLHLLTGSNGRCIARAIGLVRRRPVGNCVDRDPQAGRILTGGHSLRALIDRRGVGSAGRAEARAEFG